MAGHTGKGRHGLYQKRGYWYVWGFKPSGERWARSTGTKKLNEAKIRKRTITRDVLAEADVSAREEVSLNRAFQDLLASLRTRKSAPGTLRTAASKAGVLLRVLGRERDIATLLPPKGHAVLMHFVETRIAEGMKRSTVASEVSMLKQALRVAMRAGKWPGDTRMLKIDELHKAHRPRKNLLLPAEAARMLMFIPPQWRDHAEMYLNTGVRRMELYAIEASDVDLDGNRVHVRGTKTDLSDRRIPLTPRARAILVERAAAHSGGPLFNEWTRALPDLAAACAKAGVPRATVTDLRRSFASALLSAGVTASVLKEIMGHATTKQIDLTYGHASEAAKQEAARLLPGSSPVAGVVDNVRQKRRKRPASVAKTPENANSRSTSANHILSAFRGFLMVSGV